MILRILVFVVALGAAGGAAWMTSLMQQQSAETETVATEEIETHDVLVAVRDIPGGEVLSPDKLRWQPWPVTMLNARYITREARPQAMTELAGTFVNAGFVAGEPVRDERLAATNINLLSTKIAPGMRAVAVKISAENTAGGFVLPGDRVDVLHTVTRTRDGSGINESRIVVENARVLAIDQTAVQNPEGSALGSTATLELNPRQAEQIMAAEASGFLSLALRPVTDHAVSEDSFVRRQRQVRVNRGQESQTVTLR